MAFSDYDATPGNNSTIQGIDVSEGCNPAGINNAIRQLMADGKALDASLGDGATGTIGTDIQAFNAFLQLLATQGDVQAADIADSAITAAKIAADAVTTAKIADGAVTAAKADSETTLTDDDTKLATSGGVIDYANGGAAGPIASTSGTAIEFNSIPADTTEVTILLRGVSLSGTDNLLVQLSTGSTYATSGYTSTAVAIVNTAAGATSSTAGFVFTDNADSNLVTATIRLEKEPGSNAWLCDGLNRRSALALGASSGEVTLGGVLDGVRIVTTGSDTFDGGAVSIKYKRRAA